MNAATEPAVITLACRDSQLAKAAIDDVFSGLKYRFKTASSPRPKKKPAKGTLTNTLSTVGSISMDRDLALQLAARLKELEKRMGSDGMVCSVQGRVLELHRSVSSIREDIRDSLDIDDVADDEWGVDVQGSVRIQAEPVASDHGDDPDHLRCTT